MEFSIFVNGSSFLKLYNRTSLIETVVLRSIVVVYGIFNSKLIPYIFPKELSSITKIPKL